MVVNGLVTWFFEFLIAGSFTQYIDNFLALMKKQLFDETMLMELESATQQREVEFEMKNL